MNKTMRGVGLLMLGMAAACVADMGPSSETEPGPIVPNAARSAPPQRNGAPFSRVVREQLAARGINVHAGANPNGERTTVEQKWITPTSSIEENLDFNPAYHPDKYSVYVEMRLPSGTIRSNSTEVNCSGTLVGSKSVLTAAHCVYGWQPIGFESANGAPVFGKVKTYAMKVMPRRNASTMPYGPVKIKRTGFDEAKWPGGTPGHKFEHDYAVLGMQRPLAVTLPVASLGVITPAGQSIQASHYPYGIDNGHRLFHSEGTLANAISAAEPNSFRTDMSMEHGSSGAGVFEAPAPPLPDGPVVGIITWEDPLAGPPGEPRRPGQWASGTPNVVLMLTPTTRDNIQFLID